MEKKELVWKSAKLVYDFFKQKSTYVDLSKAEKENIRYIVCIDDDPDSAIEAAKIWHSIKNETGKEINILCVGGLGMLSTVIFRLKHFRMFKSEADRLAFFCSELKVPYNLIIRLGNGTNTGENIAAIGGVLNKYPGDVVFSLTQRLSMRFYLSWKKQFSYENKNFPEPKIYLAVHEVPLEQACNWTNCKAADENNMMMHELASIYIRMREYVEKGFQVPLEIEVPEAVEEASILLEENYGLKNHVFSLKSIAQKVKLIFAVMVNQDKIIESQKKDIAEAKAFLGI